MKNIILIGSGNVATHLGIALKKKGYNIVQVWSNHMFTIADTILSKSDIKFKLLLPLINQTVSNLVDKKPANAQTGPAKRNDKEVIDSHLNNITDQTVKEIYRLISNSIIKDND